MNIFDEKYEIRFARYDEIRDIMDFIEKYWKSGHILSRNRSFFEYEFVVDDRVNFVIARSREVGDIHGIIGFIPSNHNPRELYGWDVVWKVREDVAVSMLGIELKKRLRELTGVKAMLSVGDDSRTSVPIMRVIFKSFVTKMNHYYCLACKDEYRVARIEKKIYRNAISGFNKSVVRLYTIDEVKDKYKLFWSEKSIPMKDYWYIEKKYFRHPIYKYMVYGLGRSENSITSLMICREQECNGEKVLRIIDYIGEQKNFAGLGDFFESELNKYEYIDMYCYGMCEEYILDAGMVKVQEDDANIIPDYFNPYELRNVDIWVGSSTEKDCVFFKGDADQDRPC